MYVLFPVVGVQIFIKLLGLMILVPKISLHVTIGLIWLRCCHISIGLFMSAHIALSLNKILLALSIA